MLLLIVMVAGLKSALGKLKTKHLHYLARAVAFNQQIGRDKKLLEEVKVFIAELQVFLNENQSKLTKKEAAELIVWRNHWMDLTGKYREL